MLAEWADWLVSDRWHSRLSEEAEQHDAPLRQVDDGAHGAARWSVAQKWDPRCLRRHQQKGQGCPRTLSAAGRRGQAWLRPGYAKPRGRHMSFGLPPGLLLIRRPVWHREVSVVYNNVNNGGLSCCACPADRNIARAAQEEIDAIMKDYETLRPDMSNYSSWAGAGA